MKNFILIMMLLLTVACSKEEAKDESKNEAKPLVEAQNEPRVIKHAMGETKVPAQPKKVVVLTNEGTEAVLALGITPVGAANSWNGNPWYEHITEEMKDVTPVGTESAVNIEAVAALEPDLIIGTKQRHEKIYPQLSKIAPTVMSKDLRGNWQDNFKLYADALGKTTEAIDTLDKYTARIDDIKEQLGEEGLKKKIGIIRFLEGDTRIYMGNSFSGRAIDGIGFARHREYNPEEFAEKGVAKERLTILDDADIIFYFTYADEKNEGQKRKEEWLNDPIFKGLKASKEGKVYEVSDNIWNTAGGIKAANLMLDDIKTKFNLK